MDEDSKLQARIAALSGQINIRKQQQSTLPTPAPQYHQPRQYPPSHQSRGRWSPYARAGRAGYPQQHKNLSLVLGGTQTSPPRAAEITSKDEETLADPNVSASFVSAHGPGKKQLISRDAYERRQKQMLENKENSRVAKKQKIDREERSTLIQHASTSSTPDGREIPVNGIRFQLRDDGSKLIRILDPIYASKETPKQATVSGVDFYRTKHGNLVRAHAVRELVRTIKPKKNPQCEHFTKHGTKQPFLLTARPRTKHHVRGKNLMYGTNVSLGNCPFGPNCKFSHDPDKVAICKTYLRSGSCPEGDSCDLSHVPTYHRVPVCTHFLRGNCTNDACLYPHIHVSSSPSVCRPFASLGYCGDGEACMKRHVFECPDYANTGFCANRESGKCLLPHIDRAGTLRKAAARQAKTGSGDESDISSDEEEKGGSSGLDDIDSDEAEDIIMGGVDNDHALTQQQDFIALT